MHTQHLGELVRVRASAHFRALDILDLGLCQALEAFGLLFFEVGALFQELRKVAGGGDALFEAFEEGCDCGIVALVSLCAFTHRVSHTANVGVDDLVRSRV